jgi:hypothetical protein
MQAGPKIFEVRCFVIVPRKSRRAGVRWAAGILSGGASCLVGTAAKQYQPVQKYLKGAAS